MHVSRRDESGLSLRDFGDAFDDKIADDGCFSTSYVARRLLHGRKSYVAYLRGAY